jgi:ABC-type polysaccharide/polyol phosphate export permease
MISEKYRWIAYLNPVSPILVSYRNIIMNHKPPLILPLFVIFVISIFIIVAMVNVYNKKEHKIIKVL